VQEEQRRRDETTAPDALPAESLSPYLQSGDFPRGDTPLEWWPYRRTTVIDLLAGVRDSSGVAMYMIDGELFDHPVAQAQDGLNALESYRLNHDPAYLDRAVANADRLIDKRVESREAWFFPYPFSFALHGNPTDTLVAPWYSAMAQGQALSLFSRLKEITGNENWLIAAQRTFLSLILPPGAPSDPYVAFVDAEGYLWLEEYANPDLTRNDRTWNGLLFAQFGVWDYWRLTKDAAAVPLFKGVAATVRRYIYTDVRRVFWVSAYCLEHGVLDPRYHEVVTHQLLWMHAITGSSTFAVFSDVFRNDWASRGGTGTVVFAGGLRTGYVFDSDGRVVASRSLTLSRTSQAPGTGRVRIKGRGYYYQITAGPLLGYWVLEAPPWQYMRGYLINTGYISGRQVTFPVGVTTGWVVSSTGSMSSPLSAAFGLPSTASTNRIAYLNGAKYAYITNGVYAGRWVPAARLIIQ
jgi:hypothetical protein